MISDILEKDINKRKLLFRRGYLLTDINIRDLKEYPFYSNWNHEIIVNNLHLYYHYEQCVFFYEDNGIKIVIIGHVYNPIRMIQDEVEILKALINAFRISEKNFHEILDELSGIFVLLLLQKGECSRIYQDCCGLMPAYYGRIDNNLYVSSHGQLIGDLCNLQLSEEANTYLNSRFYKIGIAQLCGNDSTFNELKMLSPNTFLDIEKLKITRFFPREALQITSATENIDLICEILKNSLRICSEKWKCWISLSGGIDSKMTLAAANGLYDRFNYFSFISSSNERSDALAAHSICEAIGVTHEIIQIPESEKDITDFEEIAAIMDHNQAYIRRKYGNDARKRVFLTNLDKIEVEIKSHVSEVGRAFYYKKLGKKSFNMPLSPRNMSNLAKRNMFNRKVLHRMDSSFSEFIKNTKFGHFPAGYDECDMFYWENRLPMWGSLVKQSFDISHDTTIIYNNRVLLKLFLQAPLVARIKDTLQKEIIFKLNKQISELDISVDNEMKKKYRIMIEKFFYTLNA